MNDHRRDETGLRDAVRDVDFSPAHKDKVLAATCEDGSCTLWAWEKQLQIASLDLPQGWPSTWPICPVTCKHDTFSTWGHKNFGSFIVASHWYIRVGVSIFGKRKLEQGFLLFLQGLRKEAPSTGVDLRETAVTRSLSQSTRGERDISCAGSRFSPSCTVPGSIKMRHSVWRYLLGADRCLSVRCSMLMQNEEGELLLERQAKAHAGASTSFDISPSGAYLGSATSEG